MTDFNANTRDCNKNAIVENLSRHESSLVMSQYEATLALDAQGVIVKANSLASQLFGVEPSALIGRHFRTLLISKNQSAQDFEMMWSALLNGQMARGQQCASTLQGEVLALALRAYPLGDENNPFTGALLALADQTVPFQTMQMQQCVLAACIKDQLFVEFDMKGDVQDASDEFLKASGYSRKELLALNHIQLCDNAYFSEAAYQDLWIRLRRGESVSGDFPRTTKGGSVVWLQAYYIPVLNVQGEPYKVVKYAINITLRKLLEAENKGLSEVMARSQAVIEFKPDGTILIANENFLKRMGYSLEEIRGKHHRLFIKPEYANSADYQRFWEQLSSGTFMSGEFQRIDHSGNDVWMQATYNPIFDFQGKVIKVVKFASEITEEKLRSVEFQAKVAAVDLGQAVIEFSVDGEVLTANRNFLTAMGYTLREIQGQHHSMFCTPAYRQSAEYRDFWIRLGEGQWT